MQMSIPGIYPKERVVRLDVAKHGAAAQLCRELPDHGRKGPGDLRSEHVAVAPGELRRICRMHSSCPMATAPFPTVVSGLSQHVITELDIWILLILRTTLS